MKSIFIVATCAFMGGCFEKSKIIKNDGVKSIIVILNNEAKSTIAQVSNEDSITDILSRLNEAHEEQIKFYATHSLNINYENGKQVLALCSGSSLKVDGRTYKMKKTISDILNHE